MKAVFVLFVFCWVGGIILGVLQVSSILITGVLGLVAAIVFFAWQLPHAVAGALLVFLGSLWGQQAQVSRVSVCVQPSDYVEAYVESIYRLRASQAQYVVQDDAGCKTLVTTVRFPEYEVGDQVVVEGSAQLVTSIPEEYRSYGQYLQRRGIYQTIRYAQIQLQARRVGGVSGIRSVLSNQIARVFNEPEAGVMQAMLIGERGGVSDAIVKQFRHAGISHILAISGLHISLLAGALWVVLDAASFPRSISVVGSLTVLWGYIGMIGAPPSAVRAGLFWSIALFARLLYLLVSLPTLVVLALLVVISAHPAIIGDAGFQLSFAAVCGIGMALFLTRSQQRAQHTTSKGIKSLIVVSLGATLATWPLAVFHFSGVALFGVVSNVLIVPIVPLLLLLAVSALLLSWIVPPLSYMVALVVHGLWQWAMFVSASVAHIPYSYIEFAMPATYVIWYYVISAALCVILLRYTKRSWREVWE